MPGLHIDFETRSPVSLKDTGPLKYFEHPDTDLWCASWAIEDGPVSTWRPGQDIPTPMRRWVEAGNPITAHNAGFERGGWKAIFTPRYGCPLPELEQFHCTAAMAAAMSLPRDLDGAATAAGLPTKKDQVGYRLMLQMCRPRNKKVTPYTWWDVEEKIARLIAYCEQDVTVERALEPRLRPLSAEEREVWLLDQRINERGMLIDIRAVGFAQRIVAAELDKLNKELSRLTQHAVRTATNHAALREWLNEQGVDIDSVDKRTLKEVLPTIENPIVRRVIEIRQEAGKSSTAKLAAFQTRVCDDGRIRDNLMYHGAHTGRWAGKGVQPQNFPRPDEAFEDPDTVEQVFGLLPSGDPELIAALFGPPLPAIANILRGFIVAGPGNVICAADFSNIEGRGNAWLAGDEEKLQRFRDVDEGRSKHDLYKTTAAGIIGCRPEDVTKAQRQSMGKIPELALGYQGGIGALVRMAANYDTKPDAIAKVVLASTPSDVIAAARERFSPRMSYDLDPDTWAAIRTIVDGWRSAHPRIVSSWYAYEDAAMQAMLCPGRVFRFREVAFAYTKKVLWCQLPSGRLMAYIDPKISEVDTPWGEKKRAVTYMAQDPKTKQWRRHKGYGGLFCENITQAISRDAMSEAMVRVERAGYPVILTVHDEVVCEVAASRVDESEYARLMCELPPWAKGFPLVALPSITKRYGK